MVEVIKAPRGPRFELHHIERSTFGNGIAVKVFGEMKIAGKEVVYARELALNTLQVLILQPEAADHVMYGTSTWIYHKGEMDNWASVDIFAPATNYEYTSGARAGTMSAPNTLPHEGSLWLGFIALGE